MVPRFYFDLAAASQGLVGISKKQVARLIGQDRAYTVRALRNLVRPRKTNRDGTVLLTPEQLVMLAVWSFLKREKNLPPKAAKQVVSFMTNEFRKLPDGFSVLLEVFHIGGDVAARVGHGKASRTFAFAGPDGRPAALYDLTRMSNDVRRILRDCAAGREPPEELPSVEAYLIAA